MAVLVLSLISLKIYIHGIFTIMCENLITCLQMLCIYLLYNQLYIRIIYTYVIYYVYTVFIR